MPTPDWQIAYLLATILTLCTLVAMGAIALDRRGGTGAASVAAFCASSAGWTATILLMAVSTPQTAAFWLSVK